MSIINKGVKYWREQFDKLFAERKQLRDRIDALSRENFALLGRVEGMRVGERLAVEREHAERQADRAVVLAALRILRDQLQTESSNSEMAMDYIEVLEVSMREISGAEKDMIARVRFGIHARHGLIGQIRRWIEGFEHRAGLTVAPGSRDVASMQLGAGQESKLGPSRLG